MPVTTPGASTVATDVALLLHVPPIVASLKLHVAPLQKEVVPVIAAGVDGVDITAKFIVATVVPQPLVTE